MALCWMSMCMGWLSEPGFAVVGIVVITIRKII